MAHVGTQILPTSAQQPLQEPQSLCTRTTVNSCTSTQLIPARRHQQFMHEHAAPARMSARSVCAQAHD